MEVGFIGLGKMGMVTRLQRDRHRVVVYDRTAELIKQGRPGVRRRILVVRR